MAEYVLEASNLSRIYNKDTENAFEALHPTEVQIEKGDFVAIMGPSGAGKTTLVMILSLLDKPTTGRIKLDGRPTYDYSEKELANYRNESLGFISMDLILWPNLTIEENIALPMTIAKKNKAEIKARVLEVAKLCGIEQILKKKPDKCSGGQRQRAIVCRGIVSNPKFIVADEPTGNLDSKNSHEVLGLFQQLNQQGTGVLLVTHDCQVASYSTKTIYIEDGKISKVLERKDRSQQEYYEELVELTSDNIEELF
ncbi:MAG: ABC transporter ATP-binding protein [Firmicutes bacterium]|nr:ABC transporter ATP-binding protein [Bacillota bacterium]